MIFVYGGSRNKPTNLATKNTKTNKTVDYQNLLKNEQDFLTSGRRQDLSKLS